MDGDELRMLQVMLQVMAPVGMAGFALGAWLSFKLMRRSWLRARRFIEGGAVAQGVVIEHRFTRSHDIEGGVTEGYVAIVEYRAPSGEAHRKIMGARANPLPLGSRIEVAYDRANPSDAVFVNLARAKWVWGWIMTAAFGVLALGHLVLIVVMALR